MIIFDNDMIHGLIAALVIQAALYLAQRIMTLTRYINAILDGVTSMANLIFTILIAGIMSGVSLGSQCCFYSDAVFMTAAGTGVSNVPQVRASAPYVLSGVVIAAVAFLIVGFTMI